MSTLLTAKPTAHTLELSSNGSRKQDSHPSSGMAPDPQKVQSIRQWPQPNTATEIRQFLGLASYYRRYSPHFANIAAPLNELTQKGIQFRWTEECSLVPLIF